MGDQSDGSSAGWGRLLLGGAVALSAVLTAAAGAVYLDYRSAVESSVLRDAETRAVTIPEGAEWSETRKILRSAGLVEHPVYFEIWARTNGLPREVGAGTHYLEGPLTMRSLGEALASGGVPGEIRVTFPEGISMFGMADLVEERGLAERDEFLAAARDRELLSQAGLEAESFEGYLFPETYRFREEVDPEEIVWRLHQQWKTVWEETLEEHPSALARFAEARDLGRHELVTLASIVQAETSVDEERPVVARVMLNRLEASMKLQADPTCVYGPDRYDRAPTPVLCRDSANEYSTYVVDGLPPGPIGNPGRASLEAVLDPASDAASGSYLYYCARRDGTGRHVFSSTYEEHKRAVRKHLK